jgi:hypothetical protein
MVAAHIQLNVAMLYGPSMSSIPSSVNNGNHCKDRGGKAQGQGYDIAARDSSQPLSPIHLNSRDD